MPKTILKIALMVIIVFSLLAPHFPIFADETTVSVTVPPRASDLEISTSLNPNNATYAQNEEIEIQITYGSHLSFAAPMTVVGLWSQGTIEGESSPSVDLLDYVVGSATNAYGSTEPVIDLVNRTITWTISSFPAELTDQTVSFSLKTNFNYTASQNVSFTINASLTDSGTTINAAGVTKNYQYNPFGPTPTPTSTPTPTLTPTPTNTPTPAISATPTSVPVTSTPTPGPTSTPTPGPTSTPTPTPAAFTIKTVNIRAISDKSVNVYLVTNQQAIIKIAYGTSLKSLNQSIADDSFGLEHELTLAGLLPDTKYFFRITATNQSGKTSISDIFSVKTALTSEKPLIAINTFTVTSENKILVAPVSQTSDTFVIQGQKTLVIPQLTIYDMRFSLTKAESVKSIKAILRKKKTVLGTNTSILAQIFNFSNQGNAAINKILSDIIPLANISDVNVKEVSLTQIQPGVYYGRLISNVPLGDYELFAVIADNNGNISETKLSNVKVIKRLTVLSESTKEPIEAARIYLSFYNSGSKKYEPLLPTLISIENPSFTDSLGESSIVLPQGKYKSLVSNLGYKDKNVEFVIGIEENDGFPVVSLEKEGFNLISTLVYYGRGVRDVYIYYTMQYFTALSKSLRFFNLINAIILGLFVVITFLSFRFRTHIPLRSIWSYFIYHLRKIGDKNMSSYYLEGTVSDGESKTPISKAEVYLINAKTHQTIKQTSTNRNGHFFFKLANCEDYEILTVKQGYEIAPQTEAAKEIYSKKPINISLKRSESKTDSAIAKIIETSIGFLFEYLLATSVLFEITSIPYFGLQRTLPFLLISAFNLTLWTLHIKQRRQIKKII